MYVKYFPVPTQLVIGVMTVTAENHKRSRVRWGRGSVLAHTGLTEDWSSVPTSHIRQLTTTSSIFLGSSTHFCPLGTALNIHKLTVRHIHIIKNKCLERGSTGKKHVLFFQFPASMSDGSQPAGTPVPGDLAPHPQPV